MRAVIAAAQAALLVFLPFGAALTAQPTLSLVGGSEKVCQLTGENDWETTTPGSPHPTAAKTLTNFGLDGVDLGYPVENRGTLILLFVIQSSGIALHEAQAPSSSPRSTASLCSLLPG